MRQIGISTDVFAQIWALRKEGEDTEDTILRRVLWPEEVPSDNEAKPKLKALGGIFDHRYGVHFPEGFEIERIYLGEPYRAVVRDGKWVIDHHKGGYTSLNGLSRVIGTKTENAWVNWFYTNEVGRRRPVSDLRDPEKITSRGRGGPSARVEGLILDEEPNDMIGEKIRWCDDVKAALTQLGGRASLHSIYKKTEKIRRANGRSVPSSLEATIRRTLEDFSSDSDNYRGEDWFEMSEGKGQGMWALRTD